MAESPDPVPLVRDGGHAIFDGIRADIAPGVPVWGPRARRLRDDIVRRIEAAGRNQSTLRMLGSALLPRVVVEKAGFLAAFPHLLGAVRSFDGERRAYVDLIRRVRSGDDWTAALAGTGFVLAPAACHSVFALWESQTTQPVEVEVTAQCFRHETSSEEMRLQSFTMMEYVCVGTEPVVEAFCERWSATARDIVAGLGIDAEAMVAADSFFGITPATVDKSRPPRKVEIVWRGNGVIAPTAVASVNRHGTHFGRAFGIATGEGVAHSACVAFGVDRLVLAVAASGAGDG